MGLVIEFGQHMSELLLKEERKGQIQCFGPRVYRVYRVSQKRTHYSSFLVITTLWKGLGRKVGCVSKNSENSLSEGQKIFLIWPTRRWENWVKRWQPYLKNLEKMEKILMDGSDFFRHPAVFKFVF